MIFRVPQKSKRFLAPMLFPPERAYNHLPGTVPFAYFIARWRHLDSPVAAGSPGAR